MFSNKWSIFRTYIDHFIYNFMTFTLGSLSLNRKLAKFQFSYKLSEILLKLFFLFTQKKLFRKFKDKLFNYDYSIKDYKS